jgi:hypothetical protein
MDILSVPKKNIQLLQLAIASFIVFIVFVILSSLLTSGNVVLILKASGVNVPGWIANILVGLNSIGAIAKGIAWYLGVALPQAALAAILVAGSAGA